jgi:hypothetical protein
MSVTVFDNSMESRYEARIDGVLVGVSQYELTTDTIVFLHTVVRQDLKVRESAVRSRGSPSTMREPAVCRYVRSARISGAGWIGILNMET